jgi:hypothetical protein
LEKFLEKVGIFLADSSSFVYLNERELQETPTPAFGGYRLEKMEFARVPSMDPILPLIGERPWMSRTLTILFRRDPSRDRQTEQIKFEGYEILWPDGQPVAVGVEAFCKHGLRLFGLGKHLADCREKLIKMICFPLEGRDDDLNRIPGHRVRRFFIERQGESGRVYFMDGTATTMTFEVGRDEPVVLDWLGLSSLSDGERQWFDLAATDLDVIIPAVHHRPRRAILETAAS